MIKEIREHFTAKYAESLVSAVSVAIVLALMALVIALDGTVR